MTDNYNRALSDLGFPPFAENDSLQFSLKSETGASIAVTLYRDIEACSLRISAYTSRTVPATVSSSFFLLFARAALEPFRDGFGVGIPDGHDHLCVYFSLPMENYQGNSVAVFAEILEQVEKWDELLASD